MNQVDIENLLKEFGLNSTLFVGTGIFIYKIYKNNKKIIVKKLKKALQEIFIVKKIPEKLLENYIHLKIENSILKMEKKFKYKIKQNNLIENRTEEITEEITDIVFSDFTETQIVFKIKINDTKYLSDCLPQEKEINEFSLKIAQMFLKNYVSTKNKSTIKDKIFFEFFRKEMQTFKAEIFNNLLDK